MRPFFADAGYWIALINPKDALHQRACTVSEELGTFTIVTSEMVLIEVLNGLAKYGPDIRQGATDLVHQLYTAEGVQIVPHTSQLFKEALALYSNRQDKGWGLTDCASFIVMCQEGITEALAHDHHFEQMGFKALLRAEN